MAKKKDYTINGQKYKRIRGTVGHKINAAGNIVPVTRDFYGKTIKEAETKRKAYIESMKGGFSGDKLYFGIVAEDWLNNVLPQSNLAKRTIDLYKTTWRRYMPSTALYMLALDEITPRILQSTYNNLKCPPSALASINKAMKRFYKYLEIEGLSRNMTYSLELPKKERVDFEEEIDVITWTDEEIKAILNGFEEAQDGFRIRFLLVLAYYTGARLGELLGLKYDDFLNNDFLRINKQATEIVNPNYTNQGTEPLYIKKIMPPKSQESVRKIPLNKDIIQELAKHKSWHKSDMLKSNYRTDYVFTTNTGEFYDRSGIATMLKRYYKRIGVDYKRFHTYRHTFGTNLHKNGVPIEVAAKLMGHASIQTTIKYYIKIGDEQMKQAVETLAGAII